MKKKYNSKKNNKKPLKSKVIIYVEDKKSFTNYLKALFHNTFNINKKNICINGIGCDPYTLYQKCRKNRDFKDVDKAYIIFDKDEHKTFEKTIEETKKEPTIVSIVFIPCSEYFLYLHFADRFIDFEIDSAKAKTFLTEKIPDYEKNQNREFFTEKFINIKEDDIMYYRLCKAYYLLKDNHEENNDNQNYPSSNFHMFIDEMIELFPTELNPLYNALNKYKK